MSKQDTTAQPSVKKYQASVPSKVTNQRLLDLEVDLVVLCQELIKLADFSGRTRDTLRDLRLLGLEQELPV